MSTQSERVVDLRRIAAGHGDEYSNDELLRLDIGYGIPGPLTDEQMRREATEQLKELGHATCDNCGRTWPMVELVEPSHLAERLDEDGPMPVGECPECGALAYPETMAARTLRELAAEIGYSDGADGDDEGGVDALIDYKNALEERLTKALNTLEAIAAGVPQDDEWRSAADFMEATATKLEWGGVERPKHYEED